MEKTESVEIKAGVPIWKQALKVTIAIMIPTIVFLSVVFHYLLPPMPPEVYEYGILPEVIVYTLGGIGCYFMIYFDMCMEHELEEAKKGNFSIEAIKMIRSFGFSGRINRKI
jgi:hypothetical protein